MNSDMTAERANQYEETVIRHLTVAIAALNSAKRFAELLDMDIVALTSDEMLARLNGERNGILHDRYVDDAEMKRWWHESDYLWSQKDTERDVNLRRART